MKNSVVLSLIILISLSCSSYQELANSSEGESNDNAQMENSADDAVQSNNDFHRTGVVGTVRLSDEGCKVYIEVIEENDAKLILFPINIEDQFKIDYAAIIFDYNLSRAPMPTGCLADYTVTVTNVQRIRN